MIALLYFHNYKILHKFWYLELVWCGPGPGPGHGCGCGDVERETGIVEALFSSAHAPYVFRLTVFPLLYLDAIQLCFLHPSKYKFEHPRFCFERLEYVGQKIQVPF